RRPLRPCGTHRALPDGDRRKKRGIDFTTQKHSGILPAWSKVSENQASNWGARRHPASSTLKMRFQSLAAARNRVRIHPETRPATSPRAPAAATPFFLTPPVSRFLWGRPPGLRGSPWTRPCLEESIACHSDFRLPTPNPPHSLHFQAIQTLFP